MAVNIQGLDKLLKSTTVIKTNNTDGRSLEELSSLIIPIREKLTSGAEPSKEELRIIVSYFRLYRKNASSAARTAAAKKRVNSRKALPKLSPAEEQALIDNL